MFQEQAPSCVPVFKVKVACESSEKGKFLLPTGWDASPSQGYPQCTHLYTWMERGTVRVKGLAQEHSTMSPARARTQTGVECTNHEARAPLLAHARPVLWQNFQLLYFSSRGFTSVCLCQMVTLISLHEASFALILNSEKLDHENRPTAKAIKAK